MNGENGVTLSQLIELTNAIRVTTADKINGIQKVTGLLRMLALNAMIESARAGAHGTAVSLVTEIEARLIRRYEKDLGISLRRIRLHGGEVHSDPSGR